MLNFCHVYCLSEFNYVHCCSEMLYQLIKHL